MTSERDLRRKLTLRSGGASIVLVKRPVESIEHVIQKALLWAMYLPRYPNLRVEVPFGTHSRYKPDLLALDGDRPRFWGECGVVSSTKLSDLLRRHRHAHFVFSKWNTTAGFDRLIERALKDVRRDAPVELICFPADAAEWIGDDGTITLQPDALDVRRWEAD